MMGALPGSHPLDQARILDLGASRFDPEREREWLELRPDDKGMFDELIAKFADGMIVAEMMSNKGIHIGIYWDDGRYCDWWINSKKKLCHMEDHGIGEPPRFTAQGVDTKPHLPDYAALATEARRAATGNTDAVHEGAGLKGNAQKGGPDVISG